MSLCLSNTSLTCQIAFRLLLSDTHYAISPAQLYLVHHPKFMNVFCKLLPDTFQV